MRRPLKSGWPWLAVAAVLLVLALVEVAPTTRAIAGDLARRTRELSAAGPSGRVIRAERGIDAVGEPLYVDALVGNLADTATVTVAWRKEDATLPDMKIGVVTDLHGGRYLADASIANASFSLADTTMAATADGALVSKATVGLPYRSRQDGAVRLILGVTGAAPDRRFSIDRMTVVTTRPSLGAIVRRLLSHL